MTIRSFKGKSYIAGWFNPNGVLVDVQQYATEAEAHQIAAAMEDQYQTFFGELTDVTDWDALVEVEFDELETESKNDGNQKCADFTMGQSLQREFSGYKPTQTYGSLGVNDRLHLMFCYLDKLAQLQSVGVSVFEEIYKVNKEIQNEMGL